jgi:FAD synthase
MRVKLEMVERIRPEQKFDNADSLKAQIAEDLKKAREILASA